jgi:Ca2+-binding RTX toxin-like protein
MHIDGNIFSNHLDGTPFNDTIHPGAGNDTVHAGGGNDRVDDLVNDAGQGNGGNDQFYGQSGNDTLYGWTGNDRLDGGTGVDKLYGEAGNDTIVGGTGNDSLTGGAGNDRFVYQNVNESPYQNVVSAGDEINGFDNAGPSPVSDLIDLEAIDADSNAGNGDTDFVFLGVSAAHAGQPIGSLWVHDGAGQMTYVHAETDGDAQPELTIRIDDGAVLASAYWKFDFDL